MNRLKVLFLLAAGILLFVFNLTAAETDTEALLNLLTDKKIVTPDEAAGLRADEALKKQEEKENQKVFGATAGKPLAFAGYIQTRGIYDRLKTDSFDIRRARLDLKGNISAYFDYRFQADFGGTAGPFLLDAQFGYKPDSLLKITIGQLKIPISQENLADDQRPEFINRSQVVEALTARSLDIIGNHNGRDIGAQISGTLLTADDFNVLEYTAGVFNGSGINRADKDDFKDAAGRIVFHPFLKELSLGASYYDGRNTVTYTAKALLRERLGAEIAYLKDGLSLKAEYLKGRDDVGKSLLSYTPTDREGWYVSAAYAVIPDLLQASIKYDKYDPDIKKQKNETIVYTAGLNWFFNKNSALQVNYEIKNESAKEIDNNALTGQLTIGF